MTHSPFRRWTRKSTLVLALLGPLALVLPSASTASAVATQAAASADGQHGSGVYERQRVPCLTAEERFLIQSRIDANLTYLGTRGKRSHQLVGPVSFSWPLQAAATRRVS